MTSVQIPDSWGELPRKELPESTIESLRRELTRDLSLLWSWSTSSSIVVMMPIALSRMTSEGVVSYVRTHLSSDNGQPDKERLIALAADLVNVKNLYQTSQRVLNRWPDRHIIMALDSSISCLSRACA